MDEESLQNSRSRCRSLDIFLVVSMVLCFSMLVAVAVAVVLIRTVKDEPQIQERITENTLRYKMQDFAHVRPNSVQLIEGTMLFDSMQHGTGDTIGSHYAFDPKQSVLMLKKTGMYFLYVELNLTCAAVCKKGNVSVVVRNVVSNLLTCTVSLPEGADSVPQAKKCWTVSRIEEGSGLITKMSIFPDESKTDMENWKLDINSSALGMFLVG